MLIVGPNPGVGKSFISSNIATIIAQSGKKVLLIDADLRRGNLIHKFSIDYKLGLSDYLKGKISKKECLQKKVLENLDLIGRGSIVPMPSDILLSNKLDELINWAKNEYDMIFIDSPPVLAVADSMILGRCTSSILMVGRYGSTAIKEIELCKRKFELNQMSIKGFILNGVISSASSAYGYGYNYHYSYESIKS